MKLTFQSKTIAIYDSVLAADEYDRLWLHFQNEQYQVPNRGGNWIKVWRLNDGASVSSKEYLYSKRPFGNPLDRLLEAVAQLAREQTALVGTKDKDWRDISVRSYLYARGCKLSWHDDTGGYSGAFNYYAHPQWGATWGGELLIAETGEFEHIKENAQVGPYLDSSWENRYLLGVGRGLFIIPKPNRLVYTAAGVHHAVNRVDDDAGDHARCSVSGFFLTDT